MGTILKTLMDVFGPVFKEGSKGAINWLFRGSPVFLRVVSAISLLVFLSLTGYLWEHLTNTGAAFMSTLSTPLFQTAQTYKGLEAFILSDQPSEVDKTFKGVKVTSEASSIIAKMTESITTALSQPGLGSANPIVLSIQRDSSNPSRVQKTYLTDDKPGFLFVPGVVLANHLSLSQATASSIGLTFTGDPSVYEDVLASQSVAEQLCQSLRDKAVFDSPSDEIAKRMELTPHQAYFLTRSGVARLCELDRGASAPAQRGYYGNQFPATTLFQDRPYFEPTIAQYADHPNSSDLACKYFYCTLPYIDLGGNGFVQTFCRAVPIQKRRRDSSTGLVTDGVLCMDFSLAGKIDSGIKKQLGQFGGISAKVACNTNACWPDHESPSPWSGVQSLFGGMDTISDEDIKTMSKQVVKLNTDNALSSMFGKIYVYPANSDDTALRFSIPVDHRPRQGSEDERVFVYGKLDLHRYQRYVSIVALVAGGSLLIAILAVLLIFAGYGFKLKEQERAFATVDRVMDKVPVAYARLNDEGKLIKFNEALISLFGFETEESGSGHLYGQPWEDLLADEASRKAFEDNKAQRKSGSAPDPYVVRVWAAGQRKKRIAIEVHADDIPGPRLRRGKLGASFGILLNASSDPAPALQLVSKQGS